MDNESHRLQPTDVRVCVDRMAAFLEEAYVAAEVPTFGRTEPERVIRMRKTGALPGDPQRVMPVFTLPAVLDIMSVPAEIREVLRAVFYRFSPSGVLGRGAFLVFAKQASVLTESFDSLAIDAVYRAVVNTGEENSGPQQASFSQFCMAVQAIAALQQQSGSCSLEMLQSVTERYLRPLLNQAHAGQVPEPCRMMWDDSYVTACTGPFRARLQQPFKYYSQPAKRFEHNSVDRSALYRFLKDFGFFPRMLLRKQVETCCDVVLAVHSLRVPVRSSPNMRSAQEMQAHGTPDDALCAQQSMCTKSLQLKDLTPNGDSSPVRPGTSKRRSLSQSLTFEEFLDAMVLCAIAAFAAPPDNIQPEVEFNGDISTRAQALWTNDSEEAKTNRAHLLATMRAWSAAVRPRYTSEYKPTGLCWLPPSTLPNHVADGVPLQKSDYDRMVKQVGNRYLNELLEQEKKLLAQGQHRNDLQKCHWNRQKSRLTLQRRAGQV